MPLDHVVVELRNVGVFPKTIDRCATIFETCPTVADVRKAIMGEGSWSCSVGQFLYFHVEGLFRYNPAWRDTFLNEA